MQDKRVIARIKVVRADNLRLMIYKLVAIRITLAVVLVRGMLAKVRLAVVVLDKEGRRLKQTKALAVVAEINTVRVAPGVQDLWF